MKATLSLFEHDKLFEVLNLFNRAIRIKSSGSLSYLVIENIIYFTWTGEME